MIWESLINRLDGTQIFTIINLKSINYKAKISRLNKKLNRILIVLLIPFYYLKMVIKYSTLFKIQPIQNK